MHRRVRKAVKGRVIGGVHRDQLALQVGRQFGHFDTVFNGLAFEFVAIVFAGCRLFQVDQTRVPAGHLHTFVAAICCLFCDAVPRVEWRFVSGKLCQEQRGAFDIFHGLPPCSLRRSD